MTAIYDDLRKCGFDPKSTATRKKSGGKGGDSGKTKDRRDGSERVAPTPNFTIDVRFLGGLSQSQEDVFQAAAQRWQEIIIGELQTVQLPTGEVVDGLLIDAQGVQIDGPLGTLGRAGPQFVRQNSLPAKGIMEFDIADLQRMEQEGSLVNVIIHEMGHVIGIGTIWDDLSLIVGCPTANPIFLGDGAIDEFADLLGGAPAAVPVANTGGPGTRCGHWRESVFGHELMTGFLNSGSNPISRMTIAALSDMGYEVNMDAADPYVLPSPMELALMGIGADGHRQQCQMCGGGGRPIQPVMLPKDSHRD